ncbi:MAG TPA: hypothetical protein VIJ68_01840 [Candidatus Saccharimonadales bacterium]
MSSFEVGYCSPEEYARTEGARLQPPDLSPGGLYTVMFRLGRSKSASSEHKQQAARYPSRVHGAQLLDSGLYKVGFTILNADLGPDFDTQGDFLDGFLQPAEEGDGIAIDEEYKVVRGYFRTYANGDVDEKYLQAIVAEGDRVMALADHGRS